MHLRKRLSLVALVAILSMTAPVAKADPSIQDKQHELDAVNQQKQQSAQQLNQIKDQEFQLIRDLQAAKMRYDTARQEERAANAALAVSRDKEAAATAKSQQADEAYKQKKAAVAERLRKVHKRGAVSQWGWFLEWIKGKPAPHDGLRMLGAADNRAIAEMKSLKAAAEKAAAEAMASRAASEQIAAEASAKAAQRQKEEQATNVLVQEIISRRMEVQTILEDLSSRETEIQDQINRLIEESKKTTPPAPGHMVWPAEGPITDPFGPRIHPIFGTAAFHRGLDIGAPTGAPIMAALSGTVILVGWDGAYGNYVIVDHGGGIVTLYAHSSQVLVSVGQEVGRGDTIALIGSTGWSTGPHLHFEVRRGGTPEDPMGWLP